MNEKTEAGPPKRLEEAPAAFRSPAAIEQPEHSSWRPEKPEDLRGQDLRNADLQGCPWLLPEHLAGSDLTGNWTLPDEITKFAALDQVAAISSEARKVFIGLLAACVYSWLVIGTTKDVDLILNTASSPLPIINTSIPIAGFYVVGAALLAAVYCYFHFYLQRLWRTLASLPAVFPDGTALDDRTDPWLLTNLVRADFQRLQQNAPPLTRLENLLAILLAWWLVPLTLLALWARYLPAHYWLGTTWLVALVGITALFGRHSYRLAGATLRGEMPAAAAEDDDGRGVPRRAWYEFRQIRSDQLTVGLTAVLIVCSLSAFRDNPQDAHTWVAKGLNFVGIRTYANLREVNVAEPPDVWDGKDWSKVKRRDLRGRNLAFADGAGAFLANTDLRGANLTGADLSGAQLQGADLGRAQLDGAELSDAQLQGADFGGAQLQGAELGDTQLQDAELGRAQLQGADLGRARLQGANVSLAKLQGANLSGAELQGANLSGAELQGADLGPAERRARAGLTFISAETAFFRPAQLQGADLRAARLEGANLSGAELPGRVSSRSLAPGHRPFLCPAPGRRPSLCEDLACSGQ